MLKKSIELTGKGHGLRTKVPKEAQDLIIATVTSKEQKVMGMRVWEQFLKFQLQSSQMRIQKAVNIGRVTNWSPNTVETFGNDRKRGKIRTL